MHFACALLTKGGDGGVNVTRVGGVTVNFVTRAAEIRQPTAVVGRPKREMPNFVARVSPIQINHDPPTTTLAPTGLTNMHDIVEVSNSIFDGIPLPKTKKKRVEGV